MPGFQRGAQQSRPEVQQTPLNLLQNVDMESERRLDGEVELGSVGL